MAKQACKVKVIAVAMSFVGDQYNVGSAFRTNGGAAYE